MINLVDTYEPIDEACETWLGAVEKLINNKIFLTGVGMNPTDIPNKLAYPVVSNCADALKLWGSQEMWKRPA